MKPESIRQDLIRTALDMNASGLNSGTSGNLSVRDGDGFLVTPSGIEYASLQRTDIVHVGMDGTPTGTQSPSSEWRFHRVVHAHPEASTALACLRRPIPAFHYMVAVAGGVDIRCADYATFGTQALSDAALVALEGRRACLLANHGLLSTGPDLDAALALAREVEHLAAIYLQTLAAGEPVLLETDEMAAVLEKFRHYGRRARDE